MKLIIFVTLLLLSACNKPDPNPELKDPIYADLNAELALAEAAIAAEAANLKKFQDELAAVVPQTGQIKYAQKRVEETKSKLARHQQQRDYFELKIAARKKLASRAYLEAFHKKTDWPDPEEWRAYQLEKKFRSAKKTWDVKERMKEAGAGISFGGEAASGNNAAPKGAGSQH